jgi:hypothetical protein
MIRESLAIQRKALGERHPVVAATFNSLSRVLSRQGRYEEAAVALQSALKIAGPALGPDHQLVAIYTLNLAAVQLARRTPDATASAEILLHDGLRIRALAPGVVPSRRRTVAEDDWSLASARSLLDAVVVAQRR